MTANKLPEDPYGGATRAEKDAAFILVILARAPGIYSLDQFIGMTSISHERLIPAIITLEIAGILKKVKSNRYELADNKETRDIINNIRGASTEGQN